MKAETCVPAIALAKAGDLKVKFRIKRGMKAETCVPAIALAKAGDLKCRTSVSPVREG